MDDYPSRTGKSQAEGSVLLIAAKDGDITVVTVRLVWDCGYTELIKDVLVLPEYQGKGVGTIMMTQIIDYLKSKLEHGYAFWLT